ncbi:MAG: hypothetical protein R3F42_01580 [Pseudomonadota bacterium]
MTYETTINNRAALALYYVKPNEVYVFIEKNRNPDSRYLLDHRRRLDSERAAYAELSGTMSLDSI